MIELLQPEIQQFIDDHLDDQPADLMLRASQYPGWPMKDIVNQIVARKKAQLKLPDWFGQKGLIWPAVISMEQCSSQRTATYKSSLISGKSMTDLTGGFGVDTYYLSRQFSEVTHVEMNEELHQVVSHNFGVLKANINTVRNTAEKYLQEMKEVDLVYIDPARRDDQEQKVIFLDDYSPNVIELLPLLLEKAKTVMIKASPMLDIKKAINDLKHVEEVHVVALNNEVKELLFLLRKELTGETKVKAVNLATHTSILEFLYSEEDKVNINYSSAQTYIYEPNLAILKAGAFKSVVKRFNLNKLHPNSHLYTSDRFVSEFPGRSFKLMDVLPLNKKKLRSQFNSDQANITVRNYPMSVQAIRQKTGLKDGGKHYILATTDMESRKLLLCEKV
ncbi:class I SAM-dependent methyltransferase [Roseivirga sp.]|uniref:class I SAM-dependent methyltransferase n=1 Tax=Roseivirga sp. TaxID=1964215 RepID=UPI003B51D563